MSKTAKDYPVTFPYGATTSPYSPSRPHLGDDRSMPTGTPVTVNGVAVGLSGSTGISSGPHLHTQKVQNGQVVKPTGGGFKVSSPVNVTEVGYKSNIGNYVRYKDAKGVEWSQFHLSKVLVKKGKLTEEEDMTTKGTAIYLVRTLQHKHSPSEASIKSWTGLDNDQLYAKLKKVYDSDWFKAQTAKIKANDSEAQAKLDQVKKIVN